MRISARASVIISKLPLARPRCHSTSPHLAADWMSPPAGSTECAVPFGRSAGSINSTGEWDLVDGSAGILPWRAASSSPMGLGSCPKNHTRERGVRPPNGHERSQASSPRSSYESLRMSGKGSSHSDCCLAHCPAAKAGCSRAFWAGWCRSCSGAFRGRG